MRLDTLTLAIVIFVLGLLISTLSISDVFGERPKPPAAHQQGFTIVGD